MGIRRTIRLCAETLRTLRQRHQPAISTAVEWPCQRFDILRLDTRIPSLNMILWARVRPVVRIGWVWCRTLAERCWRTATGSVGGKVGQRIVEVGDAVVAGVFGAALARRAADQVGSCVVADAWLTVCVLEEELIFESGRGPIGKKKCVPARWRFC